MNSSRPSQDIHLGGADPNTNLAEPNPSLVETFRGLEDASPNLADPTSNAVKPNPKLTEVTSHSQWVKAEASRTNIVVSRIEFAMQGVNSDGLARCMAASDKYTC